MFGKLVSELQSGVTVADDSIEGTIKYVTGYTGFSSDPELQEGNFLALRLIADPNATSVKVGLDPSQGSGMVPLDSDMNIVLRIADKDSQILKVVTTIDGEDYEQEYLLDELVCETE